MSLQLAALLHDADDRKYFSTKNYENARIIMKRACADRGIVEETIYMIDLVSCSKNGDSIPNECVNRPELLWPRWADRLEAVGEKGVVRCWQYNMAKNEPISNYYTPKPKNHNEALFYASHARFERYTTSKKSSSMLDHYYDKLIHISRPEHNNTRNIYFNYMFKNCIKPFLDVCVIYTNECEIGVENHILNLC